MSGALNISRTSAPKGAKVVARMLRVMPVVLGAMIGPATAEARPAQTAATVIGELVALCDGAYGADLSNDARLAGFETMGATAFRKELSPMADAPYAPKTTLTLTLSPERTVCQVSYLAASPDEARGLLETGALGQGWTLSGWQHSKPSETTLTVTRGDAQRLFQVLDMRGQSVTIFIYQVGT